MASITNIRFGETQTVSPSGGTIWAYVLFDEDVKVTGEPILKLINDNAGGDWGNGLGRTAQMLHKDKDHSTFDELHFSATYGADTDTMDTDHTPGDILTIGANALDLNGGTINDGAGEAADITNTPQAGAEIKFEN